MEIKEHMHEVRLRNSYPFFFLYIANVLGCKEWERVYLHVKYWKQLLEFFD